MFHRSNSSGTIIQTLKNIALSKMTSLIFPEITIPEHCLQPVEACRPTHDKNSSFKSTTSYDSQQIFSQAMRDTQMIEYAYSIRAPGEQPNPIKSALNNAFQDRLLSHNHNITHHKTTYEILKLEENTGSLQGSIFLDHTNQIIIVALAGTRLDSTSHNMLIDIWDDVRIACGFTTSKTEAMMRLNDYIIREFQTQIKDGWSLHYTGHSSGAHLADFLANHMCGLGDYIAAQDFEDTTKNQEQFEKQKISVTSFESVGGITPLKNAAAICGYKITNENDQRLFEGGYYVFNSRANFINSLDKQSNAIIFIIEHEEHGPNKWWQFWKTQTEHRSDNFVKVFEGKGCIVGPDGRMITYSHNKIALSYTEGMEIKIDEYKIAEQSTPTATEATHHEFIMTSFDVQNHKIRRYECDDVILAKILSEALHTNRELHKHLIQSVLEAAPYLINNISSNAEGVDSAIDSDADCDLDDSTCEIDNLLPEDVSIPSTTIGM